MENRKKVKTLSMELLSPIVADALENQCDVKFTVTGNSMYPLLRHGLDSVVLTSGKNIKKYDIILYKRQNDVYVLHRVVKIKGNVLFLCGDNEQEIEYPVYDSQVIAKVKGFYRKDRYFSCSCLWYRLYSIFWVFVLPRRYLIIRLLGKIVRAIKRLRRRKSG